MNEAWRVSKPTDGGWNSYRNTDHHESESGHHPKLPWSQRITSVSTSEVATLLAWPIRERDYGRAGQVVSPDLSARLL